MSSIAQGAAAVKPALSPEAPAAIEAPEGWSYPEPCPEPDLCRDGVPMWLNAGVLHNRPPGAVITDQRAYRPLVDALTDLVVSGRWEKRHG